MNWVVEENVIYKCDDNQRETKKVAIFDLDFTLIKPKTWEGASIDASFTDVNRCSR